MKNFFLFANLIEEEVGKIEKQKRPQEHKCTQILALW